MYQFFLGNVHFPIAPESFSVSLGSNNRVINLLNGEDINILKSPKLKEINFTAILPEEKYPFGQYYGGFVSGKKIAERITQMQKNNDVVQFIVFRHRGLKYLGHINLSVNVESCVVEETAEQGFDSVLKIKLKEFRRYYTRIYTENADGSLTANGVQGVQTHNGGSGVYTVQSGDTLWDLAAKHYGDGSKYTKIYDANRQTITNPRLILPGQKIIIP